MDLDQPSSIIRQSKIDLQKTKDTSIEEHSVKICPSIEDLTGTKGISACNICGKSFKRPGYLQHHTSCHTETNPSTFVQPRIAYMCPVSNCAHHSSKGFTAYHSLRRHFLRTHVARTLTCPKAGCNKRFSFPADLKAHLQFCGQKLYCEICGQILSAPSSLRIHKMRKHNINNATNSYTEENFKPILYLKNSNNKFIIRKEGEEKEEKEKQLQQSPPPPLLQSSLSLSPPLPPSLIKPKTHKLEDKLSITDLSFIIPPSSLSSSSNSCEYLIPSTNHKSSFTPVISLSPSDLISGNNSNSSINITPIKKNNYDDNHHKIFPESITSAAEPLSISLQPQSRPPPNTNNRIYITSPITTPIIIINHNNNNNNNNNKNYNFSCPSLSPPPTIPLLDDFQQQQQLFMNNYMASNLFYQNKNNNNDIMYNIFQK